MRCLRLAAAAASFLTVPLGLSSCGGGGGGLQGAGGAQLVTLTTTDPAPATTGVAYSQVFDATFPNPPGAFLVTGGHLPAGLALDKDTGAVTGYPRQTGIFDFTLAARDGNDPTMPPGRDENFAQDARQYRMNIALGPPHILPQSLPAATYRTSYGYQIDLAGGTAPYTFLQTGGTLPSGMSVDPTGFVGNTATSSQVAPYGFQVTVTDANGLQDTATFSLQVIVLPLIVLTSNPIQQAAQNFAYSLPLTLASPGGGAPYAWSQHLPLAVGETNLSTIGMEVTPAGVLQNKSPSPGPTTLGTFTFTVEVVDEPAQHATRQLSLKVNPGPVLTLINPSSASAAGPFTATGLNFQSGAQLIFFPGATQTVLTPTFVNGSTLTFNGPVPKPVGGNGKVAVTVKNPDGGSFTKPQAFTFPATNLAFATKGFISSALSSTGLDCADVNGDLFADIVHCGTSGQTVYSGSPTSTNAGLRFHKNLGGGGPSFSTTVLDSGSWYDCRFADVNVDGKMDIVALGAATIRVWLGDGAGNFAAGPTSALAGGFSWPSEMWIEKFNSDAIPDIAFSVSNYPAAQTNGRVHTMTGTGTGAFTIADAAISSMPVMYGVISLAAADSDGDGRAEIIAGQGMGNYTSSNSCAYSSTNASAFFNGWTVRGPVVASPYYASTTGVTAGDFLGTGTKQIAVFMSGSTYNPLQIAFLFSGSGYNTYTQIAAPTVRAKCCAPLDGDFDAKMECAVSLTSTQVHVYRGSVGFASIALTLDTSVGSPGISSPQLGRVATGDINGDGAQDILATTSYWQTNGMAANYGSSYSMANTANGGSMGIVFWLNTSN